MPTFANPAWLLALLLLPAIWLLFGKLGSRAAVAFSSTELLGSLGKPVKRRTGSLAKTILISLVFFCWILALARPQQVKTWQEIENTGIEMIIALDVSNSMQAMDFETQQNQTQTRLDRAKEIITQFAQERLGDKIGLLVFSGQPALLSPLTTQITWLIQHRLPLANTNFTALEEGTAIGSAVASSILHLSPASFEDTLNSEDTLTPSERQTPPALQKSGKFIILVTDGANNAGILQPSEAATIAAQLGIRIYTIAVGSPGKKTIPIQHRGFLTTATIESYEEDSLKKIAQLTGGQFFQAANSEMLQQAFTSIDELEKVTVTKKTFSEKKDLFWWLVALGFGFLCVRILLQPVKEIRFPE